METLTNEQIEQKKQLIVEKMKQMKAIYDELVEAGAIELTEDELDGVAGGGFFQDVALVFTGLGEFCGDMAKSVFKKETWEDFFSKETWTDPKQWGF